MFKLENLKAKWGNRKAPSREAVSGKYKAQSSSLSPESSKNSKTPEPSQTFDSNEIRGSQPNGEVQPAIIPDETNNDQTNSKTADEFSNVQTTTEVSEQVDTSIDTPSIERKGSARSVATAPSRSNTGKYIPRVDRGEDRLIAQQQDFQQSLLPSKHRQPKVDCRIRLALDRESPCQYFEEVQIAWQRETDARFDEIENGVQRWLLDKYRTHEHKLCKIAGTCHVYRVDPSVPGQTEIEVDSQVLEQKREWSGVLRTMLERFFFNVQNQGKIPKIELRWEYSSLIIQQAPGQSYADAVREAVELKMEKNWAGQSYLPRGVDKYIFEQDTIEKLIDDDTSLQEGSRYRKELMNKGISFSLAKFKRDVWLDGSRILAVCIYSEVPLEILHRLITLGYTSSDLPLEDLPSPITSLKHMSRAKCTSFLDAQGSFVPHYFEKNPGPPLHTKINDRVVIPIWYDNSRNASLGEGTYGTVYKATIWPGHHAFAIDRNTEFAVKVWKTWDEEAERLFEKEEIPLSKLHQIQCGNIVLHLASWSQGTVQGRRFYMLFPLANFNLAAFMSKAPAPDLDRQHVSWFFGQLFDLIDTVGKIHTIKPLKSEAHRLGAGHPYKTGGYHHDLKPSNILAFLDREDGRPSFKIADFGVAKLGMELASTSRTNGIGQRTLRSKNFAGDPVYCAPDWFVDGEVGRKADIWSLGCCFLEMLSWNFGLGGTKLEDFFQARYHEPPPNRGSVAAYYYQDKTAKTVALKPAVVTRLQDLSRICDGRGQFAELIKQIELMLTLTPDTRQSAAEFRSSFWSMHTSVLIELAHDPDAYLREEYLGSSAAAPLAPVTADYDHDIDDRQVEAPYSSSPMSHHRSRSSTSSMKKQAREHAHYGEQFLSPDVDDPSSTGRPRSLSVVSIEITDHSDPIQTGHPPAIIGGLQAPPTSYEIPPVSRQRRGSDSGSEIPD